MYPCTDKVDRTHVSVCAVLFCPSEQDTAQSKDDDQEDDCEWTITLQPHIEGVDAIAAPPPVQALTLDLGQQLADGSQSPGGSTQADSSTLPSCAPEVTTHMQSYTLLKWLYLLRALISDLCLK